MAIGIGGAGGKIAAKISSLSTVINVSQTELDKVNASEKILAYAQTSKGQLKGAKKNPEIGRSAFASVRENLMTKAEGELLITSAGGGSGNGITSQVLELLSEYDEIPDIKKTRFLNVLPYAPREPQEYIDNALAFLKGPLSKALDSGNTGNIYLFSNRCKFENRLAEDQYNEMIVDSMKQFESIPAKGQKYELLEGHIDEEDFQHYVSKSFFNYFCHFDYHADRYFGDQLNENPNPLLLQPANAIEAMFLLEVPNDCDPTIFYNILDHFDSMQVKPIYSVVRNPEILVPHVTVSLLYSSKPRELVEEFNNISEAMTRTKIDKALDQYVKFEKMAVNMQEKAEEVADESGKSQDEILSVLKRLGKLKK